MQVINPDVSIKITTTFDTWKDKVVNLEKNGIMKEFNKIKLLSE